MIIGILKVELYMPVSSSLKEKRMILKSLKDKTRRAFNVSLAELALHDKWQRSIIGIAAIGTTKDSINSLLDKIVNYITGLRDDMEMLDYEMEIL